MTGSEDNRHVFDWMRLGSADPAAPWEKANANDRDRALAIVDRYAERQTWTAEELAEFCGCRFWEVMEARWLALCAGLLARNGKGGFRVTARGREAA